MPRIALITGITGQDGSYLAEFLLAQGYLVHGTVRPDRPVNRARIEPIAERLTLHSVNLLDHDELRAVIERVGPDEIYNLAAQSFVPRSWSQPVETMDYTSTSVARLLEAIRAVGRDHIRYFQASSSELFGNVAEVPQRESTPFRPRSPYGVAKLSSHWITVNFREIFGMYCVSGILYNHESPRRGKEFVTRKITDAAARIKLGLLDTLELGSLDARRDWGFAGDYVQAMWRMLQASTPDDFVVGTGKAHSVREFVALAFGRLGLDPDKHVRVSAEFVRRADVDRLVADPTKARERLGWSASVSFEELVAMMVDADLELVRQTPR